MTDPISMLWYFVQPNRWLVVVGLLVIAIATAFVVFGGGF